MKNARRGWLVHPSLTTAVEVALGVIFILAALPKIADPPAFAHVIYNYRMLPGEPINLLVLFMPWAELFAGLAILFGVWRPAAAGLLGLLLVVFVAAIGFNLLRGHAVDCGCFDVRSAGKSEVELLREMKWVLVRDLGMLLLVAQSLLSSRTGRGRWPRFTRAVFAR